MVFFSGNLHRLFNICLNETYGQFCKLSVYFRNNIRAYPMLFYRRRKRVANFIGQTRRRNKPFSFCCFPHPIAFFLIQKYRNNT